MHETHFRKSRKKTENYSKYLDLVQKYRKFKKGKITVFGSQKQLKITN